MDVGEAFLHDAEYRGFEIARETAEIGGQIEVDPNTAAFGKSFEIEAQGGGKANFIQQRRMKQVRNGAELFREFGDDVDAFLQFLGGTRVRRPDYGLQRHQ